MPWLYADMFQWPSNHACLCYTCQENLICISYCLRVRPKIAKTNPYATSMNERKLLLNAYLWMPSRKFQARNAHCEGWTRLSRNKSKKFKRKRDSMKEMMMLDRRTSKCGCSRLSAKEEVTLRLYEEVIDGKRKVGQWRYGNLEDWTSKRQGEALEMMNKLWRWVNGDK